MFILFFVRCIAVMTWTHDVTMSVYGAGWAVVIIILRKLIRKKRQRKTLWYIGGLFILAGTAVTIKEYRYFSAMPDKTENEVAIGTGLIQSRVDEDTYVINYQGRDYRYQSKKDYDIGMKLWITSTMKPGLLCSQWLSSFPSPFSLFLHKSTCSSAEIAQQQSHVSSGVLREFDYPVWMMMKGYYGVIYEDNTILLSQEELGRTQEARVWLLDRLTYFFGHSRTTALTAGMLIGDRSQLGSDDYQSFIHSGLVHIIAVSGGNMVMLVVFISAILFFIPFYARTFIILMSVLAFAMIVGPDSSVIRAAIMGGLTLLALLSGRMLDIRRALSIAVIVMLLYNPYFLLYDIGFIFSFSAVLGLIKSTPYTWKKKSRPLFRPVVFLRNNYLLPSLGASIGVLPFLLFFTGKFNLFSLLANIIVLPIVPFVMIHGLVSALFGQWGYMMVRAPPHMVNYIFNVSERVAQHGQYIVVKGQLYMLGLMLIRTVWLLQSD